MGDRYYYVQTSKEFAKVLCIKQGYEINVTPPTNGAGYYAKEKE
jgi:hypothetical protein